LRWYFARLLDDVFAHLGRGTFILREKDEPKTEARQEGQTDGDEPACTIQSDPILDH
jgi:hypothetical protein